VAEAISSRDEVTGEKEIKKEKKERMIVLKPIWESNGLLSG